MKKNHFQDRISPALPRPALLQSSKPVAVLFLALVSAASAIVVKELSHRSAGPALVALSGEVDPSVTDEPGVLIVDPLAEAAEVVDESEEHVEPMAALPEFLGPNPTDKLLPENTPAKELNPSTRWFNGRPVLPVKTITMIVTAYSPDARSCAGSVDDITASLHHVSTNNFKMVAADSKVLPLGSMITVPGYDSSQIVPVLDRGGKIKGNRLDVLFPTHEEARQWGVKKLRVVVWGYADGLPSDNWRAIRDAKR